MLRIELEPVSEYMDNTISSIFVNENIRGIEEKAASDEWNILAISFKKKERYLLRILRAYGEFKGSGFKDVIVGKVENREAFLDALNKIREDDPEKLRHLSQIVPVDRHFQFVDVADFNEKLKKIVPLYLEVLESRRFYVRVKRRGHKGELSSMEIEREISSFIIDQLEKSGKRTQVNFGNPDRVIIVETIGNRAGVGLIKREMRERYPFIRVK